MKNLIYSNWWIIVAIIAMGLMMVMGLNKSADAADLPSCYLIRDQQKMYDCLKLPKFDQEQYNADPYYCFGAARYDAMSRGWNCKDNFKESLIK